MRQSLKDYIVNVQTERSNVYKQVKPIQNNFNKMRFALVELRDEKEELKQNLEESIKISKEWEAKFIEQADQAQNLSKFVKAPGQTAKKIQERFIQYDFSDLSSVNNLQTRTSRIEKSLNQQSYSQDFTQKLANKFKRPVQSLHDISELSNITKDNNGTRLQFIQEDAKVFEDERNKEVISAQNVSSQGATFRIGNLV